VISLDEVVLLLRGWAESRSRLRVIVQSPEVVFSAFCTVYKAERERVAFWIGTAESNNAIDFLLTECRFDFRDSPSTAESDLSVGGRVESGIVGVRGDFSLAIMLLVSDANT
jgi:hypothetical protein